MALLHQYRLISQNIRGWIDIIWLLSWFLPMIEYVAGYIKKEQQVHEKLKFETPKVEFFKRIV